jgi:hypothetical protein
MSDLFPVFTTVPSNANIDALFGRVTALENLTRGQNTLLNVIQNKILPNYVTGGIIQLGANPANTGAINIDGATYNLGIVFTTNAVIRGGTNGFQIQNSTGARNNFSINDAGNVATLTDGTNIAVVSASPASGETTAGARFRGTGGVWVNESSGTAGNLIGVAYFDGTQYRSAVQIANSAAFPGALLLMKSGGSVVIGPVTPGNGVGVFEVATASTIPSSNAVGGGSLYANAGAGVWRGSGGSITTFGAA